jgi:hypothetical protein
MTPEELEAYRMRQLTCVPLKVLELITEYYLLAQSMLKHTVYVVDSSIISDKSAFEIQAEIAKEGYERVNEKYEVARNDENRWSRKAIEKIDLPNDPELEDAIRCCKIIHCFFSERANRAGLSDYKKVLLSSIEKSREIHLNLDSTKRLLQLSHQIVELMPQKRTVAYDEDLIFDQSRLLCYWSEILMGKVMVGHDFTDHDMYALISQAQKEGRTQRAICSMPSTITS